MGSVFRGIFGGSKSRQQSTSSSSSSNQAYPFLQQQFGGMTGYGGRGADAIAALLGIGGDQASQETAFDRFRDSSGYNFMMDEGTNAITGNAAARGLLSSGSTAKRLTEYGQGLASQYMKDYLAQLGSLAGMGLQAGQVISGAGNTSQSQSQSTGKSSSKPGIASFLGQAASGIAASDPRLKEDVVFRSLLPQTGLSLYSFRYKGDPVLRIGVMANEVKARHPSLLGPETEDGYMTVDYDKLWHKEKRN